MTPALAAIVRSVRRAMPRNIEVMAICDALDSMARQLATHDKAANPLRSVQSHEAAKSQSHAISAPAVSAWEREGISRATWFRRQRAIDAAAK